MYQRAASLRQRATSAAAAIRAPSRYATLCHATLRHAGTETRRQRRAYKGPALYRSHQQLDYVHTTILRYRWTTVRDFTVLKGVPYGERRHAPHMETYANTWEYPKPGRGTWKNEILCGCTANNLILPTSYGKGPAAREESARQDDDERQRPERGRFGGRPLLFSAQQCVQIYVPTPTEPGQWADVWGRVKVCKEKKLQELNSNLNIRLVIKKYIHSSYSITDEINIKIISFLWWYVSETILFKKWRYANNCPLRLRRYWQIFWIV